MARFTIPPPNETAAFEELAVIIQEIPRFALVFAICASMTAAVEHINRYQSLHPTTKVSTVQLGWPDGRIYVRLAEVYEKEKPNVIFVFGMEYWTERGDDAKGNEFTAGINHGRDFIHDNVRCPVVFWCTPTVYNHIRRNAHDFYSTATATLRISEPVGTNDARARYRYKPPISTLQLIGTDERQSQIADIQSLLEEFGQNSVDGLDIVSANDQISLLIYLGALFYAEARYIEARSSAEKALAVSENLEGADPFNQSRALNLLAHIESVLGNKEAAKLLYSQVLSIEEKIMGRQHHVTAATLHNLATIDMSSGDYERAKRLYHEALAIKTAILGKDHPETLSTIYSLAQIERLTGRYANARELFEQILAVQERTLGRQHPDTAGTLKQLGAIELITGRYHFAKGFYEQALAIEEATIGHWNPETALTLEQLAIIATQTGNLKEAQALQQQATSIREKTLVKKNLVRLPLYRPTVGNVKDFADINGSGNTAVMQIKDNPNGEVMRNKPIYVSSFLSHRPPKKRKGLRN